jgi:hypothetical protein
MLAMGKRRVRAMNSTVREDGDQRGVRGRISRADVLAVYEHPDGQIRKEITVDVLTREFLLDPKDFEMSVKDGVVAVRDRLSYPAETAR